MNRPSHAADCPGCKTGWTTGELLCRLCAYAVHEKDATLFGSWLRARAALHAEAPPPLPPGDDGWAAIEAFRRGLLVGTAQILSREREAVRARIAEQRAKRRASK
jgi:hypothetical protein